MKKHLPALKYFTFLILLILSFVFVMGSLYGQTTTALGGSWNNAGSWDNGVPSCGSHTNIIIPNNTIIEIKNTTIDLSSCDVQIDLEGTLDFDRRGNGGNVAELLLGSNSSIVVQNGGVLAYSNKNSQYNTIKIIIGGTEVWDGTDGDILSDGIINGASVDGSQVPLPVELAYFKVEEVNNELCFRWKTYSEINNDYFIIQKLNNDMFINLGYLTGYGTTNTEKYYEYTTELQEGYFRLVQVDFDGHKKYYDLVGFFFNHEQIDTEIQYYNLNGQKILSPQSGLNILIINNKPYKLFR
jgi:hypothetical protein